MQYFHFIRFLSVQFKLFLMYKKCIFCQEMFSVLTVWLPIYPCVLAIRYHTASQLPSFHICFPGQRGNMATTMSWGFSDFGDLFCFTWLMNKIGMYHNHIPLLYIFNSPANECWVSFSFNWTLRNKLHAIKIQTFSFTKMHFKLYSAKWRPFVQGRWVSCLLNCTSAGNRKIGASIEMVGNITPKYTVRIHISILDIWCYYFGLNEFNINYTRMSSFIYDRWTDVYRNQVTHCGLTRSYGVSELGHPWFSVPSLSAKSQAIA